MPTCLVHVDLYMGSIRSLRFYGNDLLNDHCKCDRRDRKKFYICDRGFNCLAITSVIKFWQPLIARIAAIVVVPISTIVEII